MCRLFRSRKKCKGVMIVILTPLSRRVIAEPKLLLNEVGVVGTLKDEVEGIL